MKLFILRHGEAESFASRDSERALTVAGDAQTRAVLQESAAELQQVGRIFASPYKRAQQTAGLAAEQLGLAVENCELLTPDRDILPLIRFLDDNSTAACLLVSHQPLVGRLVDWLTGAPRGRYFMGTSALACIDAEVLAQSCATLNWLRQPGESARDC